MRSEILVTARRIAGELRSSENDCDLALATNARLVASLLDARRQAGLPAVTGREALERALEAVVCAGQARGKLLDAHAALAELNLRELATGDLSECPKLTGGLSLVGDEERNAA
jgi:hypothetical protein